MEETYFYHSFPRWLHDKPVPEQKCAGLTILRSIMTNGLLVMPEIPPVSTDNQNFLQHRLCFTALSESQLLEHSKEFGCFALEYDYQTFRRLGGIPTFYLPTNSVSTVPDYSISGLAVLTKAKRLERVLRDLKDLKYSWVSDFSAFAAERGLDDVHQLHWILNAVTNLVYPTDNLRKGPLTYYQQREWKIVPNFCHPSSGKYEFTEPNGDQKRLLLRLNQRFFSKSIGTDTNGASVMALTQCRFFFRMGELIVPNLARRAIVPRLAIAAAKRIVGDKIPIEALECLPKSNSAKAVPAC